MPCAHPALAGYAFCGQCGEATDAPRCLCGFVGTSGDRYCGRCGRDLRVRSREVADTPVPVETRRGLPDLAKLAREAAADQGMVAPQRKANVTQDEIRKMIAARRGKA